MQENLARLTGKSDIPESVNPSRTSSATVGTRRHPQNYSVRYSGGREKASLGNPWCRACWVLKQSASLRSASAMSKRGSLLLALSISIAQSTQGSKKSNLPITAFRLSLAPTKQRKQRLARCPSRSSVAAKQSTTMEINQWLQGKATREAQQLRGGPRCKSGASEVGDRKD